MTNNYTIKEITNLFLDTANTHLSINDTGWGNRWEINLSHDIKYPQFWLEEPPFLIEYTKNQMCYNLAFYILDRCQDDETDRLDILTKTQQIGQDIIGSIMKTERNKVKITEQGWSALSIHNGFKDKVQGWRFDIQVCNGFDLLLCDLPFDPNTSMRESKLR